MGGSGSCRLDVSTSRNISRDMRAIYRDPPRSYCITDHVCTCMRLNAWPSTQDLGNCLADCVAVSNDITGVVFLAGPETLFSYAGNPLTELRILHA